MVWEEGGGRGRGKSRKKVDCLKTKAHVEQDVEVGVGCSSRSALGVEKTERPWQNSCSLTPAARA